MSQYHDYIFKFPPQYIFLAKYIVDLFPMLQYLYTLMHIKSNVNSVPYIIKPLRRSSTNSLTLEWN